MRKIDEAFDRIRLLECPTGDLEKRVTEILEDYRIADRSNLKIDRDKKSDRNEAQAYRFDIAGEGQSFIVLAKSGHDDYVATVLDVYNV